MYKVVAAHQPNFAPYLGFFDKMRQCDTFVIRDEVLFVKKEFHNRNRIRINSFDNDRFPQSKWLGVPVIEEKDYIRHIKIDQAAKIKGGLWKDALIHDLTVNYRHTPFFEKFFPEIEQVVYGQHTKLMELNLEIIELFSRAFGIRTRIVFASSLGLKPEHYEKSDASQDLADICRALGADEYLSGPGAAAYLSREPFDKAGISVAFHKFTPSVYRQGFPGFVPNMSALDALFCVGGFPEKTVKTVEAAQLTAEAK